MGTIISSRKKGKQVLAEVLSDYDEYLQLKGHLDKVYLFSENISEVKTNISQRGKNSATKYFLIPRQFRKDFKFNSQTSCQRIDLKNKVIFVYVVDKLRRNPSKIDLVLERMNDKKS